jgi:MATE family, multidrug efflux pump
LASKHGCLALVFPLLMLMQQMANSAMGGAIAASIARARGRPKMMRLGAARHRSLVISAAAAALFAALWAIQQNH